MMATSDTARDIIARVIHDELAGSDSEHGYGCDHRVGRQPQCGRAADEAMEKIAAETAENERAAGDTARTTYYVSARQTEYPNETFEHHVALGDKEALALAEWLSEAGYIDDVFVEPAEVYAIGLDATKDAINEALGADRGDAS